MAVFLVAFHIYIEDILSQLPLTGPGFNPGQINLFPLKIPQDTVEYSSLIHYRGTDNRSFIFLIQFGKTILYIQLIGYYKKPGIIIRTILDFLCQYFQII